MYLFHDSTLNTWRLITEKLPDKPRAFTMFTYPPGTPSPVYEQWKKDIATLKQNALTVGNAEIIQCAAFQKHNKIGYWQLKHPHKDKFYEWPGGYETKEIQKPIKITDGKAGYSPITTVAILTLPEEKKNTMENMTKEQTASAEAFADSKDRRGTSYWKGLYDGYLEASGSVAAPKEELWDKDFNKTKFFDEVSMLRGGPEFLKFVLDQGTELASLRQQLKERDELIANLKQDIVRLVEDVNKAYEH